MRRLTALGTVAVAAALGGVLLTIHSSSATGAPVPGPAFAALGAGSPSADDPWRGMAIDVDGDSVRSVTIGGRRAWIGSGGADWICVAVDSAFGPGRFGACAHQGAAVASGSFAVSHPAPDAVADERAGGAAEVVGLLPDGVRKVGVRLADGSLTVRTVESNLVAFTAPAEPVAYEYADAAGQVHHVDLGGAS